MRKLTTDRWSYVLMAAAILLLPLDAAAKDRKAEYEDATERCLQATAEYFGVPVANVRLTGVRPVKRVRSLRGTTVRLLIDVNGRRERKTCLLRDRGDIKFLVN